MDEFKDDFLKDLEWDLFEKQFRHEVRKKEIQEIKKQLEVFRQAILHGVNESVMFVRKLPKHKRKKYFKKYVFPTLHNLKSQGTIHENEIKMLLNPKEYEWFKSFSPKTRKSKWLSSRIRRFRNPFSVFRRLFRFF